MSNQLIERLQASPVLYKEQRVVTLRMMDELHQRPEGTAGRNFREHRHRLMIGEDYFAVRRSDLAEELPTKFVGNSKEGNPDIEVILLAESGYLLLVKSFRDDLAWQVQRMLVNSYFRVRPIDEDPIIASLKTALATREAQLRLARDVAIVREEAAEARHTATAALQVAHSNHGYLSILAYARLHGMEMPVAVASQHGRRLTAICKTTGQEIHKATDPRFGPVNLYPESVIAAYFDGVGA